MHGFADRFGFDQLTPIDWALTNADWPMARLLIRTGGGSSGEVLQALHTAFALATDEAERVEVEALFTDVVASRPLSEEEWASVPNQVPGLDFALPAVLARSRTEAAHLVRHLQQVRSQWLVMGDMRRVASGWLCDCSIEPLLVCLLFLSRCLIHCPLHHPAERPPAPHACRRSRSCCRPPCSLCPMPAGGQKLSCPLMCCPPCWRLCLALCEARAANISNLPA